MPASSNLNRGIFGHFSNIKCKKKFKYSYSKRIKNHPEAEALVKGYKKYVKFRICFIKRKSILIWDFYHLLTWFSVQKVYLWTEKKSENGSCSPSRKKLCQII